MKGRNFVKKILIIGFGLACFSYAYADEPLMSLGIEGHASLVGEVVPSEENETRVGGYQFEGGLYADLKILCTSDRGRYFHDVYLSYGQSFGEFSYSKNRNKYTADTFTVLYRFGGFASERGRIDSSGNIEILPPNKNLFLQAGVGFAVDRYRTGPLAHNNGPVDCRSYLVRPILCFGGGLMYENVTFTVLEFRFDQRFKSQPQHDFNEYLKDHMMGAVGVYSSAGFNF